MDLELRNITKIYPEGAGIYDINLRVSPGELLVLLGPSGGGKTTLLRTICGLQKPDRGAVFLEGRDITSLDPEKRGVGFIFQQPLLFPHLTAFGNAAFSLSLRGFSRSLIKEKVSEMLRSVRLDGLQDRYPNQLSGGQQQRVALARAILAEPRVLLLDEPFSALDAPSRGEMRELFRQIQRQMALTTVFVTHDQEEAALLGDRVAFLREGRLDQAGSVAELYYRPASAAVAKFFGSATLLPGKVQDGFFRSSLGSYSALGSVQGKALALVRPEQVILGPSGSGPLPAQVLEVRFAGGFLLVHLQVDDAFLQARLPGIPSFYPMPGETVALGLRGPLWCLEASSGPAPLN